MGLIHIQRATAWSDLFFYPFDTIVGRLLFSWHQDSGLNLIEFQTGSRSCIQASRVFSKSRPICAAACCHASPRLASVNAILGRSRRIYGERVGKGGGPANGNVFFANPQFGSVQSRVDGLLVKMTASFGGGGEFV